MTGVGDALANVQRLGVDAPPVVYFVARACLWLAFGVQPQAGGIRHRTGRSRAVGSSAAESPAGLRARYRLRTPDAFRIAAALEAGCQAFLTNDASFKRVAELEVLVLDELTL